MDGTAKCKQLSTACHAWSIWVDDKQAIIIVLQAIHKSPTG
jgi:hypothetical protein